jgi:hypothetical protein
LPRTATVSSQSDHAGLSLEWALPVARAVASMAGTGPRRASACGPACAWSPWHRAAARPERSRRNDLDADFIGARYSVVTDGLYAHGVYTSFEDRRRLPKRTGAVHLAPMRLGGSEFSFHAQVPRGRVFRIVSAWRDSPFMKSSVYYVVAVEGGDPRCSRPVLLSRYTSCVAMKESGWI